MIWRPFELPAMIRLADFCDADWTNGPPRSGFIGFIDLEGHLLARLVFGDWPWWELQEWVLNGALFIRCSSIEVLIITI